MIVGVGTLVIILMVMRRFILVEQHSNGRTTHALQSSSPAEQVSSGLRLQVFVSYSRLDGGTVDLVVQEIEQAGCLVWIDRGPLNGIQRYAAPIVGAIKSSQVVALMCSRNAFQSDHVIREIYVAGDHKKPFLLFQLDPCEFPGEVLYFVSGFPRVPLSNIEPGQVRSEIARLIASNTASGSRYSYVGH
ncbi:MAG: toll/interleukin-1 receptor domain-containing protein [Rhodoplanes sp.]